MNPTAQAQSRLLLEWLPNIPAGPPFLLFSFSFHSQPSHAHSPHTHPLSHLSFPVVCLSLFLSSILLFSFSPVLSPSFQITWEPRNLGILTYRGLQRSYRPTSHVVHEKTTVPRSDLHKNMLLFWGEHMAWVQRPLHAVTLAAVSWNWRASENLCAFHYHDYK